MFALFATKKKWLYEKNNDFEEHIEKHYIWKYIRYIWSIILKKRNQYTGGEYFVWKQIRDKKIDWFPEAKDDEIEDEEEEEEDDD